MPPVKIIIIDDEALARTRIRKLLQGKTDIVIIGECRNGKEAVECINEKKPDIVFLDVQMPEYDGFKVLQMINMENLPAIVFVTAYDKYALKAFDVHAVDYLLKPFDDQRFFEALEHARSSLDKSSENDLENKLRSLLSDLRKDADTENEKEGKFLERLVIKSSGKINFVKVSDIHRIKAAGKYLSILTNNGEYLLRQTMNEMENDLDPEKFLRIHRSTIVNVDYIKEMQTYYRGDYVVILTNGEKFTTSSSYKENIDRILK